MLIIKVPLETGFNETTQEFVVTEEYTLELEHSLVSLSKWESFFKKPWFATEEKTVEETLWYYKAMTLTPNVPPEVFQKLTQENGNVINAYIGDSQTATWFNENPSQRPSRETITSELIYYWLIAYNIPFECENWHLNRLMTLVKICNVKNAPAKKTNKHDELRRRRDLNEQRKAQLGTRG